jgi:hypothetical protein
VTSLRTPEVTPANQAASDVARTLVSAAPRLISAFPALAGTPEEGRDESRSGRQECLRHENRLTPISTSSGVRREAGRGWGRLQPAANFSSPVASFLSYPGRRAEARRRLKSAPRAGNQRLPRLAVDKLKHFPRRAA